MSVIFIPKDLPVAVSLGSLAVGTYFSFAHDDLATVINEKIIWRVIENNDDYEKVIVVSIEGGQVASFCKQFPVCLHDVTMEVLKNPKNSEKAVPLSTLKPGEAFHTVFTKLKKAIKLEVVYIVINLPAVKNEPNGSDTKVINVFTGEIYDMDSHHRVIKHEVEYAVEI